MEDRTSVIFGNPIDKKTIKKAEKSKAKALKKFGDDTNKVYHLSAEPVPCLKEMGVQKLVFGDQPLELPENALIIGNIRMGFGHYRISIAMASAAKALGYAPYWLDLASFDATGSKWIREQNDLYSLASRISQKSHLFNHFIWEPLNSEGFRKLTYNASDQKNTEMLVPIFHDIPAHTPYIATHAWPAQGAVHAGLDHVVEAIPDNWPMALHLAEGSIHTVQTPFAYLGYKMLNGMAKTPLKGMPEKDLYEVGHYVDDELVANLEEDTAKRIERLSSGKPVRILLTVGGAGAGASQFLEMVQHLLPYVEKGQATVFLNFGDHLDMYEFLKKKVPSLEGKSIRFFDEYDKFVSFVSHLDESEAKGIVLVENKDIFEAVYSTNLLMRKCDLLITKPSELVYYPIPKVFQRHIGGHEVYGGIHGREFGDATWECEKPKQMNEMIDRLLSDREILEHLSKQVLTLKGEGLYDGAYECVKLAVKGRE